MSKLLLLLVSLACGVALVVVGATMLRYHYGFEDAIACVLVGRDEDTDWSADFDESAFDEIGAGESPEGVRRRLGDPVLKSGGWEDRILIWNYAWQSTGTDNCHWRAVQFNHTIHPGVEHGAACLDDPGPVVRTVRAFWID